MDFASTTSYQFLDDNMKMDQDYLPEDYLSLQQDQLQNSITQEFTFKGRQPFFGFWHLTQGAFFPCVVEDKWSCKIRFSIDEAYQ